MRIQNVCWYCTTPDIKKEFAVSHTLFVWLEICFRITVLKDVENCIFWSGRSVSAEAVIFDYPFHAMIIDTSRENIEKDLSMKSF